MPCWPRATHVGSIALLVALSLGCTACEKNTQIHEQSPSKSSNSENTPKPKSGPGRRDRGPIHVKIASVERRLAPRIVSAVAPLSGRTQADVYSKVVGRLDWIGPKEGAAVKANETLFKVDRSDPSERFLSVPVVSPISGWVGRWYLQNVGEQVTTNTPVLTIVDDRKLKALLHLSTTDWVTIDSQAKVTVSIADEHRPGRIVSVARAADGTSSRGSVIIEIDNTDHRWRSGMVARFQLELEPKQRMLMPAAALTLTDQGAYVFTVVEDQAKRMKVNFRMVNADVVEILDGLPNAAQVVTAGGNLLTDGAKVRIQTNPPDESVRIDG